MQFVTNLFSGGKGLLSNFDKFASSYSAPKKTNKGAVASLIIHFISFGYFGFLAYQFQSNEIEPTFAFLQQMNFNKHSIDLTQDLFGFQYFSSADGPLDEIQATKNLVYILFEVHFYDHVTNTKINIPLKKCTNHNDVQAYFCPDFQQVKGSDGQNLHLITTRQPKTEVVLTAKRCTGLPNCATSSDIDDLLSQQSYFDIVTFAKQYNHVSLNFETVYFQETYYFDTSLGINSKIKVINGQTNVYNGVFASTKSQSNSAPYDYQRLDQYNSQTLLTLENNQNTLLYLSFDLDTFSVKLDIQFPTLMGLVPLAISLGEIIFVILRTILPDFSKNALSQEVMKANLKASYSKTAHQLIASSKEEDQKNEKKEQGNKENAKGDEEDKDEKKAINSPKDLFNKFEELEKESENLMNLITKSIGGDWDSILNLFKKILPCLKRKVNSKLQACQDQLNALKVKSNPEEDLNTSIQDILFLKKAVKLLLTKEQYAAIHFCGSEIKSSPNQDEVKQNQTRKTNYNQTSPEIMIPMNEMNQIDQNYNHLEQVDNIESDRKVMMKAFQSYIEQVGDAQKKNTSDLDKRIVDSLIFDITSPPPLKIEKETENGSGSPGIAASLLHGSLGKMMPNLLRDIPAISDIPGIQDLMSNDEVKDQPKKK